MIKSNAGRALRGTRNCGKPVGRASVPASRRTEGSAQVFRPNLLSSNFYLLRVSAMKASVPASRRENAECVEIRWEGERPREPSRGREHD